MDNLYFVLRKNNDNVVVAIMLNECDNMYHFVNLTKNHICPCAFETVRDALGDMQSKKADGEIIDFIRM